MQIAGEELTHYMELKVLTREAAHLIQFYIVDIGTDNLILGYPWFAATNVHPNWAEGTFLALVIICTKGAASRKPMCSVWVADMRMTVLNRPFLQQGDELYICIMKENPAQIAKTTVAQQLVEQAIDKTTWTWDQIIPPQYHVYVKVFSKNAAQWFPNS